MNSMVNTNKKPPIDTQTLERNLQKRKDKENHQPMREEKKNNRKNNENTSNK